MTCLICRSEAVRAGRCWGCYRYRRRHGRDKTRTEVWDKYQRSYVRQEVAEEAAEVFRLAGLSVGGPG